MKSIIQNNDLPYTSLVDEIGDLLTEARKNFAYTTNTILVKTYWQIGQHIVEYEQNGQAKATYGDELINRLSKDLKQKYGKGFSRSNLFSIRQFYLRFPIFQTVSELLSWSHYVELLKLEDPLEMEFYTKQCEIENWSVRELKRQRDSLLFHRLAMGKDMNEIDKLARKGIEIAKATYRL